MGQEHERPAQGVTPENERIGHRQVKESTCHPATMRSRSRLANENENDEEVDLSEPGLRRHKLVLLDDSTSTLNTKLQ